MDTIRPVNPITQGFYVLVSWSGLLIHNYVESVDGSALVIGVISAGLFLVWRKSPSTRSLTVLALLSLGLIQFAGAVVTVIPFSFLPFSPEQTTTHYVVHIAYAAMQFPLVAATFGQIRGNP